MSALGQKRTCAVHQRPLCANSAHSQNYPRQMLNWRRIEPFVRTLEEGQPEECGPFAGGCCRLRHVDVPHKAHDRDPNCDGEHSGDQELYLLSSMNVFSDSSRRIRDCYRSAGSGHFTSSTRFAFFDDIGGELRPINAPAIPCRVDCSIRDEQDALAVSFISHPPLGLEYRWSLKNICIAPIQIKSRS